MATCYYLGMENESFTFTGDHNAVEDWADALLTARGIEPTMAVFEGDWSGIYINPDRLREIGVDSRLPGTVHVRHGEAVTYADGTFVGA